jgi:hypothetical protein
MAATVRGDGGHCRSRAGRLQGPEEYGRRAVDRQPNWTEGPCPVRGRPATFTLAWLAVFGGPAAQGGRPRRLARLRRLQEGNPEAGLPRHVSENNPFWPPEGPVGPLRSG